MVMRNASIIEVHLIMMKKIYAIKNGWWMVEGDGKRWGKEEKNQLKIIFFVAINIHKYCD